MHRLQRMTYSLAAAALAVLGLVFRIDDLLRAQAPARVGYHSTHCIPRVQIPDSNAWTDEEIIGAAESARPLKGAEERLAQISEDTIVKFCRSWDSTVSEALAMELVRKQTRIPVPRMRRTIRHVHDKDNGLIVMDLVPNGQQLRVAWPSLSIWGKLRVILSMRLYLNKLRRVQHSPSHGRPGPPGSAPLPCDGPLFGFDTQGPFPTTSDLEVYFRIGHAVAEIHASRKYAPSPDCPPLDSSAFTSSVFTHNGLNMCNLLLDDNYVLWIVDWGFAGFYPPCSSILG